MDTQQNLKHLSEKMIIGIELRTSNAAGEADVDIPKLWEKFQREGIFGKIPNKTNKQVIALYTDYEKDHTAPYSLVIGCEVSSLDEIPTGLVGKMTPKSNYQVFHPEGKFPESLIQAWIEIWQQPLQRTYTGDMEIYAEDFDPEKNPNVSIYIAVEAE